jgi:DNA-binding CsgD family transcriptional regulator
LSESPPPALDAVVAGVVGAVAAAGDPAALVRPWSRALARFPVPQWMRLRDRFERASAEVGLDASLTASVRLLGAADAYHAMREDRPHRPALAPEESAAELRADARAGRLDAEAGEAVLGAAGHRVRRRRKGPGGLTPRETDVLVCMARGMSNRDAARALFISPKTVGNHLEHIYTKLGITTRTAAALFAMQHGLVDPLEPPRPRRRSRRIAERRMG